MTAGFLPFVLIPLLVYTYFWVNPIAFATFMEGVSKYIVEVYLGFKEWKIEHETKKAYRHYIRESEKLAKTQGYPDSVVKLYFKTYGQDDRSFLRQQNRQMHEARYKDIEETMRELII